MNAGILHGEKMEIYKILAGILHIGNVVFEENISGKCEITEQTRIHFKFAANLLNVDESTLERALVTHSIEINGSETIA